MHERCNNKDLILIRKWTLLIPCLKRTTNSDGYRQQCQELGSLLTDWTTHVETSDSPSIHSNPATVNALDCERCFARKVCNHTGPLILDVFLLSEYSTISVLLIQGSRVEVIVEVGPPAWLITRVTAERITRSGCYR